MRWPRARRGHRDAWRRWAAAVERRVKGRGCQMIFKKQFWGEWVGDHVLFGRRAGHLVRGLKDAPMGARPHGAAIPPTQQLASFQPWMRAALAALESGAFSAAAACRPHKHEPQGSVLSARGLSVRPARGHSRAPYTHIPLGPRQPTQPTATHMRVYLSLRPFCTVRIHEAIGRKKSCHRAEQPTRCVVWI